MNQKGIVQKAYENFKNGNIHGILSALADNVEWRIPDVQGVAISGKRTGKQQVGQFFSRLAEDQEVQIFDVRDLISEGDKVVALGAFTVSG
jgi:ketosteroid isomerase-like protein